MNKYDGIYRKEEEEASVKGFRSSRTKRFNFAEQTKAEFQDEEDLDNELRHLILTPNYKNLCSALDLELESFEKDDVGTAPIANFRKIKKKRVRLSYEDVDNVDEVISEPKLSISLKKVDSNMKFIKSINKNDAIYTNFIKSTTIPQIIPKPSKIPESYTPKRQITTNSNDILSSETASMLLKSRFTSTPTPAATSNVTTNRRTITKITVDPLLKTRLGI